MFYFSQNFRWTVYSPNNNMLVQNVEHNGNVTDQVILNTLFHLSWSYLIWSHGNRSYEENMGLS